MDKTDYKNKVNLILEDKTKFVKIPDSDQFSKILSLQDKINRFVLKIFGSVDCDGRRSATYKFLHVTGSSLGVLYGLPKIQSWMSRSPYFISYKHPIL